MTKVYRDKYDIIIAALEIVILEPGIKKTAFMQKVNTNTKNMK